MNVSHRGQVSDDVPQFSVLVCDQPPLDVYQLFSGQDARTGKDRAFVTSQFGSTWHGVSALLGSDVPQIIKPCALTHYASPSNTKVTSVFTLDPTILPFCTCTSCSFIQLAFLRCVTNPLEESILPKCFEVPSVQLRNAPQIADSTTPPAQFRLP